MKFSEVLKRKYRQVAENRILSSIFFDGYFCMGKIKNKECRKAPNIKQTYNREQTELKSNLKALRVAAVCDDMTWQNLKRECQIYSVTPNNWKAVLYESKPDVFFCESAWTGIKEQKYCWHGKIYRNKKLLFENRKDLLDILRFCKQNKIPTVFWNKEDPAFVDSERYDFTDTALKFDYIFTTAKECVDMYQKAGHVNVNVLPFGFSPYLFNPLNSFSKENQAVFAGSWYAEETKRCEDLCNMFDKVLGSQIPLTIYDRQTGTTKEGRNFPEKYQEYVKNALPFEELGKVLKKVKYAINVNTIQDSETMFARRVLEFMAMNTFVISNFSVGMKALFDDSVCFPEDSIPEEDLLQKCLKNLEYVFLYRTNEVLFTEAFHKAGILKKQAHPQIAVINIDTEMELDHYEYVFLHDGKSELPDFERMIPHFCYLPENCGIKMAKQNEFTIQTMENKQNTLFTKEMFLRMTKQPSLQIQQYNLGISTK